MKTFTAGMALLLVSLFAVASGKAAGSDITISKAWLREAPPGTQVNAGYFTLCNDSAATIRLTAVDSARFDSVEMHRTIEADGQSRMERLGAQEIPAGECLRFEPGGRHLMLFGASPRIREGEQVTLAFHFAAGETRQVEATVHRGNMEPASNEHSHH